jgi:hypothetical protein
MHMTVIISSQTISTRGIQTAFILFLLGEKHRSEYFAIRQKQVRIDHIKAGE